MELFNKCIAVVLKNEGGYVFDKNDPGGETNFGISKRQYPNVDIKNLTIEQAKQIYYKDYWNKDFDKLDNKNLALQVFDNSVNIGKRRAIKMLQKIVCAKEDGIFGNETINKANNFVLKEYEIERIHHYEYLASKQYSFKKFLRGWILRVERTKL